MVRGCSSRSCMVSSHFCAVGGSPTLHTTSRPLKHISLLTRESQVSVFELVFSVPQFATMAEPHFSISQLQHKRIYLCTRWSTEPPPDGSENPIAVFIVRTARQKQFVQLSGKFGVPTVCAETHVLKMNRNVFFIVRKQVEMFL